MTHDKKPPRFTVDVLKLPAFRFLLLTRLFSAMAGQAQSVVVGWQIYSMTGDPFLLGLTGLAEAVPALSCALFAGHIVDSTQPRRVYFWALLTMTVNVLTLLTVGGGFVDLASHVTLICIYSMIFVSGIARSFISPATSAMLSQVVPRADMPAASAWLSTGFHASSILAPALAGIIYGGYGARGAWMVPAFFIMLGFMMQLMIPKLVPFAREKRIPAMQSIREGWQFILKTPVLLAAMSLDMLAVLFGGAVALLPAFAAEVLHTGSEGLGALRAAPAAGAIVVALYLAMRPFKKVPAIWLVWVVVGFGVCMIGFGLSTHFIPALIFLVASGIFDSVSMVIRSTLNQLLTPDNMRGRVSSVSTMFIISSNELGAFESGTLAKLAGIVPSIVFGGFGTLVVAAFTSWKWPQLRKTVVHAGEQQ